MIELLDNITSTQEDSEIDVLYSICESYHKMIKIASETNNEEIFQETCMLFMESDSSSSDNGIKDFIVNISRKLSDAVSKLIAKLTGFLVKKFSKNIGTYYATINSLKIIEAFKTVSVPSIVQEGYVDDDVVYQEGLTPEERQKRKEEKLQKKQDKIFEKNLTKYKRNEVKELIAQNPDIAKIEKDLKRFYDAELRHHILSDNDIRDIVTDLSKTASPEAIKELKSVILKFENGDIMKKLSDESQRHHEAIQSLVDKKNEEKWHEVCLAVMAGCDTPQQANARIDMVSSLVDNFGKTVSKLTNQRITGNKAMVVDTFTQSSFLGIKPLVTLLCDLTDIIIKAVPSFVSKLGNMVKTAWDDHKNRVPAKETFNKIIKDPLQDSGKEMRQSYEKFQRDYHTNQDELKRMGEKTDKLMGLTKFCLDGLGEETFIINQDKINSSVYVPENIHSPKDVVKRIGLMTYGGPCTFALKIIKTLAVGYIPAAAILCNGGSMTQAAAAYGMTVAGTAVTKLGNFFTQDVTKRVVSKILSTTVTGYIARNLTGDMSLPTPSMRHGMNNR